MSSTDDMRLLVALTDNLNPKTKTRRFASLATVLRVHPDSLKRAIHRLETTLGETLVTFENGHVRLTESGEARTIRCREFFAPLAGNGVVPQSSETLRVWIDPDLIDVCTPPIGEFLRETAGAEMAVEFCRLDTDIRFALDEPETSLVIGCNRLELNLKNSLALGSFPFGWVSSSNPSVPFSVSELADQEHVLLTGGDWTFPSITKFLDKINAPKRLLCVGYSQVLDFVEAGMGVGIVPAIRSLLEAKSLEWSALGNSLSLPVGVWWSSGRKLSELAHHLIDLLQVHFRDQSSLPIEESISISEPIFTREPQSMLSA
jgi:DNA-binding transcriptional LysR family regulator